MAKKRIIFTLLYENGSFMLSRNFRLQRAGDVNWLLRNYNFAHVAQSLDELIVIDVSRAEINRKKFLQSVSVISQNCFVPITIGGSITDFQTAAEFIEYGADKIIVNSIFDTDPGVVEQISSYFGRQCVVGGIDVVGSSVGEYRTAGKHAATVLEITPRERIELMIKSGAGEILLQSVDRDGTGNGFDLHLLQLCEQFSSVPLIVSGGFGKAEHIIDALRHEAVDAIATANLFNFIGDGLQKSRETVLRIGGVGIPNHPPFEAFGLKDQSADTADGTY